MVRRLKTAASKSQFLTQFLDLSEYSDLDWNPVTKGKARPQEDEHYNIMTSVYVTNFPSPALRDQGTKHFKDYLIQDSN